MNGSELDDLGMPELGEAIDRARARSSATRSARTRSSTRGTRAVVLVSAAAIVALAAALLSLNAWKGRPMTLVAVTEADGATSVVETATATVDVAPTTIAWDLTACTDALGRLIGRVPELRELPVVVFKDLDGDGISWPACEVYLGDGTQSIQVGVSSQPITSRGPTGDEDETTERALGTATLHVDTNGSQSLPGTAQAVITFDDGLTVYVAAHHWPTAFDVRSTVIDLALVLTGLGPNPIPGDG